MTVICPTITAYEPHEYREQIERVAPFASRIHIDLMDGIFAETKSPPLEQLWLPEGIETDIHLMYKQPLAALQQIIALHPSRVILHAEAESVEDALEVIRQAGVMAGIALLADTNVASIEHIAKQIEHVLIFSGHLGHHGGEADLGLLAKVAEIQKLSPSAEIAWDGGINAKTAPELASAGISVLNVGGFIQASANPAAAYAQLESAVKAAA